VVPGTGGSSNGEDISLPELPSAQAVLDTMPIVSATQQLGAEVARGNMTQEQLLSTIASLMAQIATGNSSTPAPATAAPAVSTSTPVAPVTTRTTSPISVSSSGNTTYGGTGVKSPYSLSSKLDSSQFKLSY
jgi:hypothetical protein